MCDRMAISVRSGQPKPMPPPPGPGRRPRESAPSASVTPVTAPQWLRRLLRRRNTGSISYTTVAPTGGRQAATADKRRPPVVDVVRGPEEGPYQCPCCAAVTLPARGAYELCPVCFWEDDGQDESDADQVRGGPNGPLSLTQARANCAEFGASDRAFQAKVRRPKPQERAPR